MENFFATEQTNILFYTWIKNHPESQHPRDNQRFNNFVLSLLENNEILTDEILLKAIQSEKKWQNKKAIDDFVKLFLEKHYTVREFWNHYKAE